MDFNPPNRQCIFYRVIFKITTFRWGQLPLGDTAL